MTARGRRKHRKLAARFHRPRWERWTWVPHIANIHAPTVAELNAGRELKGLTLLSFGPSLHGYEELPRLT